MMTARNEKATGQGGEFTKQKANGVRNCSKFSGTDNPRHLRAIAFLLTRPARREEIDNRAGCSNGPELIAELRRRALHSWMASR